MLFMSFCATEMFVKVKFLHQKANHSTVHCLDHRTQVWLLLATSLGAESPGNSGWQG